MHGPINLKFGELPNIIFHHHPIASAVFGQNIPTATYSGVT